MTMHQWALMSLSGRFGHDPRCNRVGWSVKTVDGTVHSVVVLWFACHSSSLCGFELGRQAALAAEMKSKVVLSSWLMAL